MESSLASVLLAGTDTVSAFLEWFVLYMTAFPDVQEKFFREIETVIGSRSATLKDRACTHYVEATLQARLSCLGKNFKNTRNGKHSNG